MIDRRRNRRATMACMTNVVAMISKAVMTRLARWPRVGILVGYCYIGQRIAALLTRRVCAAWWTSVGALPPVQKVVEFSK